MYMKVKGGRLNLNAAALGGVTGGVTVFSSVIDLSRHAVQGNYALYSDITGASGKSGGSVWIGWQGHIKSSGSTGWVSGDNMIRTSGTSISNAGGNGWSLDTFSPGIAPFMRIMAMHDSQKATNAVFVDWMLTCN